MEKKKKRILKGAEWKNWTDIVDSNFDGNNITGLVGCPGIVVLTERHDVYTLGTQRWPYRRCWGCLPCLQRQLYQSHHCITIPIIKITQPSISQTPTQLQKNIRNKTFLGFATRLRWSHGDDCETPRCWRTKWGLSGTEELERKVAGLWRQTTTGERWSQKRRRKSHIFGDRTELTIVKSRERKRHWHHWEILRYCKWFTTSKVWINPPHFLHPGCMTVPYPLQRCSKTVAVYVSNTKSVEKAHGGKKNWKKIILFFYYIKVTSPI